MSEEQRKKVIENLISFIERACSEDATDAEVSAMPDTVRELRLLSYSFLRLTMCSASS